MPPGSSPGRVMRQPDREVRAGGRRRRAGRAVVAMVASSAQVIFRSGFPLSSSRSRWSPSRTYQPPSGSLAHSPVRLDGPRENSGTGVASRPVEPSDAAAFVARSRTETLASISALTRRFQPVSGRLGPEPGSHLLDAGPEVAGGQAPVLGQRRGIHDRRRSGAEAVADPAVGGQEGPVAADGAGDAQQRRGTRRTARRTAARWPRSETAAGHRGPGTAGR